MPDLPVPAFHQFKGDPALGDVPAETDRRVAGPHIGLGFEEPRLARQRPAASNRHAPRKGLQRLRAGNAFDLRPVKAGMPVAWIEELHVQRGFIAQQQKALAVGIEAAYGIDTGGESKFR